VGLKHECYRSRQNREAEKKALDGEPSDCDPVVRFDSRAGERTRRGKKMIEDNDRYLKTPSYRMRTRSSTKGNNEGPGGIRVTKKGIKGTTVVRL